MKLHSMLLFFGVLIVASAVAAEKIALEVGQSVYWTKRAIAGFVRYRNDLRIPNILQPGFHTFQIGYFFKVNQTPL